MLYAALKTLHLLAIIVWVGGMLFAHFFLRPAITALDPPTRLKLMHEVLRRFFAAVVAAALVVLVTGAAMLVRGAMQTSGGGFKMPLDWTLMATLGLLMMAIFAYVRWVLFARLSRAVAAQTWPAAGAAMNAIRQWVTVNLALGVLTVIIVLML